MKSNNIETSKDIKESEKRIKLAEERDDSEQTIINISPDIFEMLQDEYFQLRKEGYEGSYNDFLRSKIRVTKADGGLISNYKIESRKP
jgi:uncharacterized protein (DUF4415 family)|tara:strand:- start:1369 stop:1632 length:264 start_codon:yes stop_codon:yes gene_type:complete